MSEANGQMSNGRFAPGNRLGRGNPHARRMSALRAAVLDATTPEMMGEITRKLGELAKGGDVPAARLLFEYGMGKATQAIELSGPEGEPLGVDWGKVQTAVLAALAPFGADAKIAVALALKGGGECIP